MNEAGQFRIKKELVWVLVGIMGMVILCFTAVGCIRIQKNTSSYSSAMTTSSAATKTDVTTATTTKTSTIKATAITSTVTEENTSDDPSAKMDNVLKGLGINFEKKWMYAEAIGAKVGFKYSTSSGTFELYLYDIESEAYKAAVKNSALDLGGTLFPATIKAGYALYYYGNVSKNIRDEIEKAFL
jgi:hypothetical protein